MTFIIGQTECFDLSGTVDTHNRGVCAHGGVCVSEEAEDRSSDLDFHLNSVKIKLLFFVLVMCMMSGSPEELGLITTKGPFSKTQHMESVESTTLC